MYRSFFKRFFDTLFSLIGIIVSVVPMCIIAIAIKLDSKGPAIYKQKRIGLNGNIYEIWKFRTMYVDTEHTGSGVYSDDTDPRITRVGNILRRTSLDEISQLFNILKGEMSFIGPRPWVVDYA